MPFDTKPDLLKHWEFLYERSLGCVGTLKRWLVRAVNMALDDTEADTVTVQHLEATALSLDACEKMALETTEYEKKLERSKDEEKADRLRELLGLKDMKSSAAVTAGKEDKGKTKAKGQVGIPNPVRYQCGNAG